MGRFAAEINSYRVGFTRPFGPRGLNDWRLSIRPYHTYISLKVTGPNNIREVNLYFMDTKYILPDAIRGNVLEFGQIYTNNIDLYLEFKSFDHCYKIIQSERPLSFYWSDAQFGSDTYVNGWEISTSTNEPLGEGDSET